MKKIVLTFNGVYLPGYKAGGPIRSIANLGFYLSENISLKIVAMDRDVGDLVSYENIKSEAWNTMGAESVYYHKGEKLTLKQIFSLTRGEHDLILLNGIFSDYTIKALILKKMKLISAPIVIMPRGDLSPGALSIKNRKKRFFLTCSKIMNLYKNLNWISTSLEEEVQIKNIFREKKITTLMNFPDKKLLQETPLVSYKEKGKLRLICISRITPVKNILFLIKCLKKINGRVKLDIYGPVSDKIYHREIIETVKNLPKNICVEFHGPIEHSKVEEIIPNYDFFISPTLGENYGHTIVESLINACPVIISDQTPWKGLENSMCGWDISLDENKFVDVLNEAIEIDFKTHEKMKRNSKEYIKKTIKVDELKKNYLNVFLNILKG